MSIVLVVLFLTIFCVAAAFAFVITNEELYKVVASGTIALLLLLLLVFIVAPFELGHGRVPDTAEEFTRRLEVGKVYRLIATEPVDDKETKILLVRDESSLDYYAIRVKIAVPMSERFTLIKGQPRGIK